MLAPDNTPKKTPKEANLSAPWPKGKSGNPKGRPKGARNKLTKNFIKVLHASFKEHGPDVIETLRVEKPDVYAKLIAGLVPKEFDIEANVKLPPMQMSFVAPDMPLPVNDE